MKKIAVFFSGGEPMDYPLSSPDYWQVYTEVSEFVTRAGGEFFVVRGQDSYQGYGRFTQSWQFSENTLVESGPVTVDIIYDKGRFERDDTTPVLNTREVQDICVDKWKTYTLFSQYCPKTFLVESHSQLLEYLPQLATNKVVFKPLTGAEGEGVVIKLKDFFIDSNVKLQFPGVLSEFLQTSPGIPGIMEGMHDMRVALLDGEIVYSSFRTPPDGKLLANVAQGGDLEVIPVSKLPQEVVSIAAAVDAELAQYGHRFYCIDFGYTPAGPKIIEMNSEMGLMPNKYHPVFISLKQKLVQVLLAMAEK